MIKTIKRNKERFAIEKTIAFSEMPPSDEYHNVKMYNFSETGIFFESENALNLDSEIIVEVGNYTPGPVAKDGSDAYVAKVVWCSKVHDSGTFGVGTEIMGHFNKNFI